MIYQKISLNGQWDLEPGSEKPVQWSGKVPVPALVDMTSPRIDWEKYQYFWYKKEFKLPKGAGFKKVYLQLEQVQFGTKIWLNDTLIGGDIPCYTSQEFDLTNSIIKDRRNELIIRVGSKCTLPEESAVGNDFEKLSFIPGIWGDVWIHLYGNARVERTRIIPKIESSKILIYSTLENLSEIKGVYEIEFKVCEKISRMEVGKSLKLKSVNNAHWNSSINCEILLPDFKLWSPESPHLYTMQVILRHNGDIPHSKNINFGMREFTIRNGSFYLNGKRRILFGSNIAFHRLLSDPQRNLLPWDSNWIKKVLVDIPKKHHMFFFRIHLGHAYNRWYDIADENGILLQDEWMFWTTTGTHAQIEKEFRSWIKENMNHPSIVIWDALNESNDTYITHKLIPKIKNEVDPSRPWEKVDFGEDHPYIYSLGPVLNKERFGYSRSIFELRDSTTPTMVNEYLYWWLDNKGEPTSLTKIVIERWLGKNPSTTELLEYQSFLASELTELWRRLDIGAILPFVYMSSNEGATANWFLGELKELQPKPILLALKNGFSPIGVSVELWDRHILPGEKREIQVYIFNDSLSSDNVKLEIYFESNTSEKFYSQTIHVTEGEHKQVIIPINFPKSAGIDVLIAQISGESGNPIAFSKKVINVFIPEPHSDTANLRNILIYDPVGEITRFLHKFKIPALEFTEKVEEARVVFINGTGIEIVDNSSVPILTQFVQNGGILILQEPEFNINDHAEYTILENLILQIQYRKDPERGGYDSYIFPADYKHFLWKNLNPDQLKIFNGSVGGEIVSQHHVRLNRPYNSVANCNIELKVPAVLEIPYGKGWLIISRIQIRGRLMSRESSTELYERRYDPVAEQYFWNLITGYRNQDRYHNEIQQRLESIKFYIAQVSSSTEQIYDLIDTKVTSRWSFYFKGLQWIWFEFYRETNINKITIHWENKFNKEFKIFKSHNNKNWKIIFEKSGSRKSKDIINFDKLETKYLQIKYRNLGSDTGYSIWELEFE
jgi:hypothetical protein